MYSTDISDVILAHIGDGVLSVDSSLKIVFANVMACKIMRFDQNTIIGRPVGEVMRLIENYAREGQSYIEPFKTCISLEKMITYARPMLIDSIKDELVFIEDTVSPIRNGENKIIGTVMVFRDVTEEVRMSAMLKIADQRYKILFDSIRSGVAVYESKNGEDFTIVDFNQAAAQLELVSRDQIIGKKINDVFPGSVKLGIVDALKRVWKTGCSERMPCSFYEDKVRSGWRDNYIYKIPTGEIVAVYDDVTEKKDTAERLSGSIGRLRDNEARLRGMFDKASVGVIFLGEFPKLVITQANLSFCEFLGYERVELIGMCLNDITHPDDREKTIESIHAASNLPPSGKTINLTKRYLHKSGKIVWGSVFHSKIEHRGCRVEHFAQVIDITDKKRAEDETAMLANIVSELNAADTKSHNTISNIMMSIKSFVQLDSVAVRLPERISSDNQITDYPFYFHDGFESEFIAKERSLCCRDDKGNPVTRIGKADLACVCGAVISRNYEKTLTCFTKGGSFWTSCSSQLSRNEDKGKSLVKNYRGACCDSGYESVAIVPIMAGEEIVGSMLLNAKRTGVFDERLVVFLEEVGKSMGVAFSRMQIMSDIENHRQSIARANGILSVECDVARNIADGSDSNLNAVLMRAGKKLGVKWLCVMTIGESGLVGRWTDERGSSIASVFEDVKFQDEDIIDAIKWANNKELYVGDRGGMPSVLVKISKPIDGNWMVIPVVGAKDRGMPGIVMMVSKNVKKWSKDECDAITGLATLLCILAKSEKNRIDLSRKIEETILTLHKNVITPTTGNQNVKR